MVIDPKITDTVPIASEKIEKPATTFDISGKVKDSIGFIQQFAMKQEIKTETLIKEQN
jgi:hypothetical protein